MPRKVDLNKLIFLADKADEILSAVDFIEGIRNDDSELNEEEQNLTMEEIAEIEKEFGNKYTSVQEGEGAIPADQTKVEEEPARLPTPKEIKAELDKCVIGQEEAKRTLAVAVHNHYKRILSGDPTIEKSNIILCGPTGCGKTLMVKTIAKMLGVPCYIGNATSITSAGYVGNDIETLLTGLLRECNYHVPTAEMGIVFVDEIDKIAKKGTGPSLTKDVSGECVQQGLLKMVEGTIVGVPPQGGRIHPEMPLIDVNTQNILFIVSGAFEGIDDIIKHRLGATKIGFENNKAKVEENEEYINFVSPQDFRDFGMIPEFVGRFPVITNVNKLEKDDLKRVLVEPENSLFTQYQKLFKFDNITFALDDEAIDEIATVADTLKTGARGLRNIMETILNDYMFEYDGEILTITKDIVKEKLQKKCRYRDIV